MLEEVVPGRVPDDVWREIAHSQTLRRQLRCADANAANNTGEQERAAYLRGPTYDRRCSGQSWATRTWNVQTGLLAAATASVLLEGIYLL